MAKDSKKRETKKRKTTKDDESKDTPPKQDTTRCSFCKKSPQDASKDPPTDSSLLPYKDCPHCDFVSYLEPDKKHVQKGEFGYVLTDLCFGCDWDRALQRVKIYPMETGLIPNEYNAETALHWAAYNRAPPELIKALARANAKSLGAGCPWGAGGSNPLMLLFGSFESLEHELELMKELVPLHPASVLAMDGECGNACLLDYAWLRIEKKVKETLALESDIQPDKLDRDFMLKWELFAFMVQQACGHGPDEESLIAALACMDNSLVDGDCPPRGPPLDVLRFAILVGGGKEKIKEQLLLPDDEGSLLLHKIAASTKRPSRKWKLEEYDMYWQGDEGPDEFETEEEYLDWAEGPYKAKHLIVLLKACPEAAQIPSKNGQLALHVAIEAGRGWCKGGVKEILEAYPGAVNVPNSKGMLPFLQAAAACKTTVQEDIDRAIKRAYYDEDEYSSDEYDTDDYDSDGELKEDAEPKAMPPKPPREDWTNWNDDQFDLTYELLRAWPEALKHHTAE